MSSLSFFQRDLTFFVEIQDEYDRFYELMHSVQYAFEKGEEPMNSSPILSVDEALDGLRKAARSDSGLLERLLETQNAANPVSTFCGIAAELGFPIAEMDLICAGEDYYAAMRRSTNGGGENSPKLKGEDDFYELFFAELE